MAKATNKQQQERSINKSERRAYIQFYKKIRTVYINKKTVSNLEDILDLMLSQNTWTISAGDNRNNKYQLGSTLYLIDIRYNTYFKSSKTTPNDAEQWFEPEHLKKIFGDKDNIKYRYCKALGNPPKIRKAYPDDPDKQKELYLQYLHSNHKNLPTKTDFNHLYGIASNMNPHYQVVLMCYCEPEKEACHRFWLKQALVNKYRDRNNLGPGPELPHYILNKFEKQLKKR